MEEARLALALGIYTGLRRGDTVRVGPQHLRAGVLTVRQEKTGGTLRIPVHTDLLAVLGAAPSGNMAFLVTEFGKPLTAAGFGAWLSATHARSIKRGWHETRWPGLEPSQFECRTYFDLPSGTGAAIRSALSINSRN